VRPKNFNEAGGVDELERRARQMRVPSRGSAVSLVFTFPRKWLPAFLLTAAPHLVHAIYHGSASEFV
jgi:hypothetical protein